MNPIKWTIEILKLKPGRTLPVVILTGTALTMPDKWLHAFGLAALVSDYRQWISTAFFISISLLVSYIILCPINVIKNKIIDLMHRRTMENYIQWLTPDEKNILRPYIFQQTRTQTLDTTNGAVNGLVQTGIIYLSSMASMTSQHRFDHNINPWAWNYLNRNKATIFRGMKSGEK